MLSVSSLFYSCDKLAGKSKVKYFIGCSDCSLTYQNSGGNTEQVANAGASWSYSFDGDPGDFVYLSAQNNKASGSVTVTITLDGNTFKTANSSGAYVIATASGSIPE